MPKDKFADEPKMGSKFGRPDIERVGLFAEMPYISAKTWPKKKRLIEGRNIMCEGPKTKNGTQHGYFEENFRRIFSKEAIRGRGRKPPPRVKNVSERPFLPPIGFKYHSTPGDYYGCFSGIIESFGAKPKPKPKLVHESINFVTSPGKMGGPGYPDIGLSPYPEHKPDRYGLKPKYKEYGKILGFPMVNMHYPQPYFDDNPFKEPENMKPGPTYVRPKEKPVNVLPPGFIVPSGKGKLKGGCQAGCFEPFPEFKSNRKLGKPKIVHENIWQPPTQGNKSYYNTSVLHQNVDIRISKKNFESFEPKYVEYIASDC